MTEQSKMAKGKETGIPCFECGERSGMDCAGRRMGEATRCLVCFDQYMKEVRLEEELQWFRVQLSQWSVDMRGLTLVIDCSVEQEVSDALVAAWNSFVKLTPTHPDDADDFRRSIHECQRIMGVRQLRRIDPDRWPTK